MQLESLIKSFTLMTDDERLEQVRHIRRNKYDVKPATAIRKQKKARDKGKQVAALLDKLPAGELKKLLESMK